MHATQLHNQVWNGSMKEVLYNNTFTQHLKNNILTTIYVLDLLCERTYNGNSEHQKVTTDAFPIIILPAVTSKDEK